MSVDIVSQVLWSNNLLFHGPNKIRGIVTEFDTPGAYCVRLFNRYDMTPVAKTFSSHSGVYEFTHLAMGTYTVIANDHGPDQVNGAIGDPLTPTP